MLNSEQREKEVLSLLNEGYSYNEIGRKLMMSRSLVAYYAKKKINKAKSEEKQLKKEQQEEYERVVCEVIPTAKSLTDLCRLMNKRETNNNIVFFKKIIDKYNIDTSHFSSIPNTTKKANKLSLEEKFSLREGIIPNGNSLKRALLKHGYKEHKCEKCGLTEWNNEPIPLQLHHINGNRYDNRVENLQLLCPNCHTQTDNFAGRNINANMKKKYKCQCCGKEFYVGEGSSKTSTIYCSAECRDKMVYSRNQYIQNKEEEKILKPDKDTLYNDFKELGGFVQVGRKYGVSDNTIRKWFKKYDLPIKTKEMMDLF